MTVVSQLSVGAGKVIHINQQVLVVDVYPVKKHPDRREHRGSETRGREGGEGGGAGNLRQGALAPLGQER